MGVKIGICEWSLPVPGPHNCRYLSELGLEGMTLDIGSYERNFPLSNKRIQDSYLEEAHKWSIEFPSIAVNDLCNYGMTSEKGTKNREIALSAIYKCIDAAETMTIPVVFLPSFFESDIKKEKDLWLTADCIRLACEYAEGRNITVCTENVLSSEDNLKLIDLVDSKTFKIYFDTQNPYLNKGYYVPDLIIQLAQYIREVHVKDGMDGDLSGALLGKGKTDFYQSMQALRKINYANWLVIENYYSCKPLSDLYDDPFELLKIDIDILKRAIKDLAL